MEWLKQQHRALWRFYREEFGESLLITAAAFLVICLLAFGVGLFFKSLSDTIISYFQEMIQLEGLIDEDGGIDLLALFGNNVRASAVSILYGFIPFLYLTALALGTNALILGVFAAYYVNNGVSLLVYLAGILPHGIFELTALMLAFAGGFLLCRQITQYVRSNTKGMMKPLMLNLLRVFILHILPLLAVAAVCCTPLIEPLWNALKKRTATRVATVLVLLVLSTAYVVGSTNSPFLYFNF